MLNASAIRPQRGERGADLLAPRRQRAPGDGGEHDEQADSGCGDGLDERERRQRERGEVEPPAAEAEAEARASTCCSRAGAGPTRAAGAARAQAARAAAPCCRGTRRRARARRRAPGRARWRAPAHRPPLLPGRGRKGQVGLGEHGCERDARERGEARIGRVARRPLGRELLAEREQPLELEALAEARQHAALRARERVERHRRVEQQGESGEVERDARDLVLARVARARGRSGTR